jgi:hypothetical protein
LEFGQIVFASKFHCDGVGVLQQDENTLIFNRNVKRFKNAYKNVNIRKMVAIEN